jgi:hypothetical protein
LVVVAVVDPKVQVHKFGQAVMVDLAEVANNTTDISQEVLELQDKVMLEQEGSQEVTEVEVAELLRLVTDTTVVTDILG